MRPSDLTGKVCLVTGSSRGIGAAVARGFGRAGALVAVHFHAGRAEAEAVVKDIASAGGRAHLLQADIAEPGAVERLLRETVEAFGRLDILVNNAGDLIKRCPVAEMSDDFFDQQIAINVRPV